MRTFDNKIIKSLEILEGLATLGKNRKKCQTLWVDTWKMLDTK